MSEKETAQNGSMEEILSSIRTIVKEEADKEGDMPIQDPHPSAMDDVLELTEVVEEAPSGAVPPTAEAAPTQSAPVEDDMVDIEAFSQSGELKAASDDAVMAARAQYDNHAFDDPPQMEKEADVMAEDKQQPDVSAEDMAAEMMGEAPKAEAPSAEDLMAEMMSGNMDDIPDAEAPMEASAEDIDATALAEAPLTSEDLIETSATSAHTEEAPVVEPEPEPAVAEETVPEPVVEEEAPSPAPAAVAPAAPAPVQAYEPAPPPKRKVGLKAIPTADGLQIGFPVEVLAEALRPLVADWVADNLPEIVEKLVREELTKLVDK